MTLNQQLNEILKQAEQTMPADVMARIQEARQRLESQNPEANAKRSGEYVSVFTLPNALGEPTSLDSLLEKGKLVLSFYRGDWCPFCNLELKALQDKLPEINALGATLAAISMQVPDKSLSTAEKNNLTFEVLSDTNGQVAHDLGLAFELDPVLIPVYEMAGIDFNKHHGNPSGELPIPATYIIDQDRKITHAFVDANYTQRAEPDDILAALKT